VCSPKVGALGDIDIETCRECGGAVRIIARIEDPVVIERILTYLQEKLTPAPAGLRPESRAPVPSSPVDDPSTSDQKGIYFSYTHPYRLSTETSMSGNRSEPAVPRLCTHVS